MGRNKLSGGLGRSLEKSRRGGGKKSKARLRREKHEASRARTGESEGMGNQGVSVTETSSLVDFLARAQMAERDFAAERDTMKIITPGGGDAASGGDATGASIVGKGRVEPTAEEAEDMTRILKLGVPRRVGGRGAGRGSGGRGRVRGRARVRGRGFIA